MLSGPAAIGRGGGDKGHGDDAQKPRAALLQDEGRVVGPLLAEAPDARAEGAQEARVEAS